MIIFYSIIALLAVLALAYTEARQDHQAILADGANDSLKGKFHRQRWIKRALFCAGFGLALVFDNWLLYLAYLPLAAAVFWYSFDGFLNRMRNLPFTYVGTRSKTDCFFQEKFQYPWIAMSDAKQLSIGLLLDVYVIVLIHTI